MNSLKDDTLTIPLFLAVVMSIMVGAAVHVYHSEAALERKIEVGLMKTQLFQIGARDSGGNTDEEFKLYLETEL